MYVIGITGPTGAGKTTALRVLEEMGGRVFDCDAVYRELLRTDGELLGRIEAAFPGTVRDRTLDRKALGARVFADPEGLEKLTGITQPVVAKRVLEEIRSLERPSSVVPFPFAVIDAIGLFESGLGETCDLTVAVVADREVRVRRLMDRDGISEAYARARIAAQKPSRWFVEQADLVLENNGTEAEFAETCRTAFTRRLAEPASGPDRSGRDKTKEGLMDLYTYITLRERPEMEAQAADWFHSKWGVPREAYLECMDAYLAGETELGWYLCVERGGPGAGRPAQENGLRIVGGLGVIENDFHDRKDLSPNVCAVYVEEAHRKQGIAGRLLNMAVEDLRARGISPVYLVTDHTGFYERYGWEFFCMAQGDGEDHLTRLYIHK